MVAMILPWLMERLNLDPAFGSGPLATVIQDLPLNPDLFSAWRWRWSEVNEGVRAILRPSSLLDSGPSGCRRWAGRLSRGYIGC